jgi:methylated-DNA-[protein]-cysteine S-methyltransferase
MMVGRQPQKTHVTAQANAPITQSHTTSPLGDVMLAATSQGLAGVWFIHRQEHLPDSSKWTSDERHPVLMAAARQLHEYFLGHRQSFDLPLQPAWGTPFQRAVWQALQRIPYGLTRTYGDIARDIGNPKAVRAVGAAIGQNPHSIIVPCHRVLGANGSLTGFAGGLDRKKHLLALEASHA